MHDWELGPGPSAGIGRIGVAQWRQACASGGEAALAAKPVPGRPRKLTDQQCQPLLTQWAGLSGPWVTTWGERAGKGKHGQDLLYLSGE
jgi:transposase